MFESLLIANRGEIARRIIRTARSMGIRTVAIYADPDARSPYVSEADLAVAIGGQSPAESYLDIAKLIDAARATGAQAVHPGYGFVSESAEAARAVLAADLLWVGPPPDVIAALGDKVRAKELMEAAGVPVLPGASLGADASDAMWAEAGERVGYPLLVKAAAGGGGRGMRRVDMARDLGPAIQSAIREAQSAFGDGTVFLERCLDSPRHIEVQVLADTHGTILHLGDRECSIQRRHQKIVEEAPAPDLSTRTRDSLYRAALAGAAAVGYVGAGTWEFLVDGEELAFLEVNTRIQVEHPVTEAITGLDLVRLQLVIAAGDALPLSQERVNVGGHAIEARVVAEDPARDWLPSSGRLHRFQPDPTHPVVGVRYDLGVASGSIVPLEYDSLLGKVIGHADTRSEAAARLRAALGALEIHGLTTNRDLLVAILGERDFLAARTTTGYLEGHEALLHAPASPAAMQERAVVAALWSQWSRRKNAPVLATIPSGWRNLRSDDQHSEWVHGAELLDVRYRLEGALFRAAVGDRVLMGRMIRIDHDGIEVELDAIRRRYRCEGAEDTVWVASSDGQTTFSERARFGSAAVASSGGRGPTAPVPGTVIAVEVREGQAVAPGMTLVVLEAMKLEHRIKASSAGVVSEVLVSVGEKVDAHQVLVMVEPDEVARP